MPKIGKTFKLLLSIGVVALVSVAIDSYVSPAYFKSDDADMLLCAKYFISHPLSIFSVVAPPAHLYEASNMAMWNYYRPVERILWVTSLRIFGFNPKPIHILEIALFICAIYNLFKLTNFFSGAQNKNAGLLFVTAFFSLFPRFIGSTLNFISHSNTILMLFFSTSSLVKFISSYRERSQRRLIYAMLLALLAFLSKEWAFYLLPSVLLLYFYLSWNDSDKSQKRIIFKSVVFIYICLIAACLLWHEFRKNVYRADLAYFFNMRYIIFNLSFIKNYFTNSIWLLSLFSVVSFIAFRHKAQVISLYWSAIMLIPALFYKHLCNYETVHYLMPSTIGLSIFISIGVYLNIKNIIFFLRRKDKTGWFDNLYQKNYLGNLLTLLNIVLAPMAIIMMVVSFANSCNYFIKNSQDRRSEYYFRKNSFETALLSRENSYFLVENKAAREFYSTMLYAAGRKDVVINIFDADIMRDIRVGENILKNGDFESGFDSWRIDSRGLASISRSQVFRGSSSLGVDMRSINKISTNFIDVQQDVTVEPGKVYLFGGRIKSEDFSGRMWIEIRDKRGFAHGNWISTFYAPLKKGDNDWVLVQDFFVPGARELTFVVLRMLAPVSGKVYIDDLFLLPAQGSFLEY